MSTEALALDWIREHPGTTHDELACALAMNVIEAERTLESLLKRDLVCTKYSWRVGRPGVRVPRIFYFVRGVQ